MTEKNKTLGRLLDGYYEYEPSLYSVQEINAIEDAVNNSIRSILLTLEDIEKHNRLLTSIKTIDKDCLEFVRSILEQELKYQEIECERTRQVILSNMEEEQSGTRPHKLKLSTKFGEMLDKECKMLNEELRDMSPEKICLKYCGEERGSDACEGCQWNTVDL